MVENAGKRNGLIVAIRDLAEPPVTGKPGKTQNPGGLEIEVQLVEKKECWTSRNCYRRREFIGCER